MKVPLSETVKSALKDPKALRDFTASTISQKDTQYELTALKAELASEEKEHAELRDVVAALREELSKLTIRYQSDCTELSDSLTAAEKRNAELVELLREVQKAARKQSWAHGYPVLFQLIDTVCAKPTESGASE